MECGPVTIVPDDDSLGHSITFDPWVTYERWEERGRSRGDDMHSIYIGRILTLMSGVEAEKELLGSCNGGDGDDLYHIEDAAVSSDGFSSHDEWKRYEPRMRRQVRRLVRKYRAKIELVAQALLEREMLSSGDVDRLVMS
jgi:hypothetical protein